MSESPITNNTVLHRFELTVDGEAAYVEYRWKDDVMEVIHTFVPPGLRGHGLAEKLAGFVLEYIKNHHVKTRILCPFVNVYLKRHPEYKPYVM